MTTSHLTQLGSLVMIFFSSIAFLFLATSIYQYIMAPKPYWRGLVKVIMIVISIELYFVICKISHQQLAVFSPWYLIWPINYLTGPNGQYRRGKTVLAILALILYVFLSVSMFINL